VVPCTFRASVAGLVCAMCQTYQLTGLISPTLQQVTMDEIGRQVNYCTKSQTIWINLHRKLIEYGVKVGLPLRVCHLPYSSRSLCSPCFLVFLSTNTKTRIKFFCGLVWIRGLLGTIWSAIQRPFQWYITRLVWIKISFAMTIQKSTTFIYLVFQLYYHLLIPYIFYRSI